MIVVDVNILAFYVIHGERTDDAHTLREIDSEWLVPAFWCVEFQSILWKYVRFGGMAGEKALALLDTAMDLFSPNELTPNPDVILRDALGWGITVYDAQYVSLARQSGVHCVTEDTEVQKACPDIAVSLADFISRPTGRDMVREPKPTYRTRSTRRA
jgi:predicted nucleic acid-binding protein